jgi:hypothetical protein
MRKDLLIHDVLGILRFKSVGESLYPYIPHPVRAKLWRLSV